jgi:hypothetical protein
VEMIVDIAFAVVPTILGFGAAGLIGSAAIRTAKDVMNSISLLKTVGPMAQVGWMAGGRMNILRKEIAERWQQSEKWYFRWIGRGIAPDLWIKSSLKKNQDTQSKQEEQESGGGGNPPVPPDTKPDKKEEGPKPTGIDTYSPISIPNPFKKKQ